MSLGLLLPIGLFALAALLLPVLLHLQRRTEPKPTPFAALRWLSMQTRPQRSLRLEEPWLLLLRLLLVAAVAALFAQPVLHGGEGGAPWVLVAPGVDVAKARTLIRDPRARWHWLAVGFPAIDRASPASLQPLSSLLREVDARLPAKTALTVVVPTQVDGLDGERPRLARPVAWRIVDASAAFAPTHAATQAEAPILVVRYGADRLASIRYLRAAALAWQAPTPTSSPASSSDIAASTQPLPGNARWLAWLAPGELPPAVRAWIEHGGVALLDERAVLPTAIDAAPAWRDADGRVLARGAALGRGRLIQLAQPLLPAANAQILDAAFPAQLRALLAGAPPAPQRAWADAARPLAGGPSFSETPRSLDPWLLLLAAGLFVLERWFASSSRRRSS
jgi:hypothetical protein